MSISFSGLASGLDTSSWVESLVALKRAKVTTLQEERENVLISKDTLSSIKTFFNSFRSTIEKITDARFNIVTMDLFAQNIATSADLNVLTATATTDADEGTYRVKVDKLATKTNAVSNYKKITTTTVTATATEDSLLKHIGVTAGSIGVTVKGIKYGVAITESDTIESFIEKLKNIGVEASFNNTTGVFSMNLSSGDIDDTIDNTGIKDKLHLAGVNEGYTTANQLVITHEETVDVKAKNSTLLSDIGVGAGTITIFANDAYYDVTIDNTTTISQFVSALQANSIDAAFNETTGIFTLNDAEITAVGTTDIVNKMGLTNPEIYSKTQSSANLTHETVVTSTTTATSATLLKDIGNGTAIANGQTVIVKNSSNEYTTITVGTATTIGNLLTSMSNAGLYAAINNDGTIEISGGTITGGTFDAVNALGLQTEPFTAMTTGDPLTETIIEHELVTLQTKLVDDLGVTEGYLKVTDADGNTYYEKIYSGQTIADFMADMGNLGIYTSLDESTGILTITGGAFETLSDTDVQALVASNTIAETDARYKKGTNLLECLYGAGTISTDQISVASAYSRTRALTHEVINEINANLDTTLETIGLTTEGTAIFDSRGTNVTINVTKSMTIDDLRDKLYEKGIATEWDGYNAKLTINNATLTGGTSNLDDVLNLTETISGKYVTSNTMWRTHTYTVDATGETTLGELGLAAGSTITVSICTEDGNKRSDLTVTEQTSLDSLITMLNTMGVSATLDNGVLKIDDGYIDNATLTNLLGLERTVSGESHVLSTEMKHTITTTATNETTLEQIVTALNATASVADGYNLSFNSQSISVSDSTTIGDVISQIYANGGTASLDSTGRLHIEGGTLTGTVATALGFTNVTTTDSVIATGEILQTINTINATATTKLSDIGWGASTITIQRTDDTAVGTITTNADMTIGDIFTELAAYGIDGSITNGKVTLVSEGDAYATGDIITSMGITTTTSTYTTTVGTVNTSSDTVKITYTEYITTSSTLRDLGLGLSTVTVKDSEGVNLGTITTNADMTIGDLLTAFAGYNISGTLEDGVITLRSDKYNYVTGGVADSLGIGTSNVAYTVTTGITNTSSAAITYTKTTFAEGTNTLLDVGIHTSAMTKAQAQAAGYTWVTTRAELTAALNAGGKIMLGANIDLSGSVWTPITDFSGTFDGNYYTISNLSVTSATGGNYVGFFERISGGTVKNITFNSANIDIEATFKGVLAGYTDGAIIDNVKVTNSTVTSTAESTGGTAYVGGIFGFVEEDVFISNCSVKNTGLYQPNSTLNSYVGGIVGCTNTCTIVNCYTEGSLIGSGAYYNYNGGLVGLNNGVIYDSKSNMPVYPGGTYGNVAGRNTGKIINVVYTTVSTTSSMGPTSSGTAINLTTGTVTEDTNPLTVCDKDGKVLGTIAVGNSTTINSILNELSEYGISGSISNGQIVLSSSDGKYVRGYVATQLGIGLDATTRTATLGATSTSSTVITYTSEQAITADDRIGSKELLSGVTFNGAITAEGVTGTTIAISSSEDLANLATLVNAGNSMVGKTFILTSDIDLSEYSNFTPIGKGTAFSGTFDGNGYTISNLKQTPTNNNGGLFQSLGGATVRNLKLDNVNIQINISSGNIYAGALAAYVDESTIKNIEISNVYIRTPGSSDVAYVGGAIGLAEPLNFDSGNIKVLSGTIDCNSTSSSSYAGGVFGKVDASSTFQEYYSGASVDSGSGYAGGIAGYAIVGYAVYDLYNTGTISGTYKGGIFGVFESDTFDFCDITATNVGTPNNYTNWSEIAYQVKSSTGAIVEYNDVGYKNSSYLNPKVGSCNINSSTSVSSYTIPTQSADINIYDSTGRAIGTIYDIANKTYNDLFTELASYGIACSIEDGVITATSTNGNYADGDYWSAMGFSPRTITTSVYSTTTVTTPVKLTSSVAVTYTETITADATTTLGSTKYVIDGSISSSSVTGSVIAIKDRYDLQYLANQVNAGNDMSGKTFVLTGDIDLSSISNWTPIGNSDNDFCGTFDGMGHTISGLTINKTITAASTYDYAGLFGSADIATFKNLTISDANITVVNNGGSSSVFRAGALLGSSYSNTISGITIDNVTISSTGQNNSVGGIVGYATYADKFSNIKASGKITGGNSSGGVVGWAYDIHTMENIQNDIDISGAYYAGGIVGQINNSGEAHTTTFKNVLNKGDITATSPSAGGIIGALTLNEAGVLTLNITNAVNVGKAKHHVVYVNSIGSSAASGNTINLTQCYGYQTAITGATNGIAYKTTDTNNKVSITAVNASYGNMELNNLNNVVNVMGEVWSRDTGNVSNLSLKIGDEYDLFICNSYGTVQQHINLDGNNTFGDMTAALVANGFEASIVEGTLQADTTSGTLTVTGTGTQFLNTKCTAEETKTITTDTTLRELGRSTYGWFHVYNIEEGKSSYTTFTVQADDTMGDVFDRLAAYGFNCSIKSGTVIIESTNSNYIVENGRDIDSIINMDFSTGYTISTQTTYITTTSATSDQIINSDLYIMDTSTKLKDIGYTSSENFTVIQNGTAQTIQVNGDKTVGEIISSLAAYGIAASIKDGKLTIEGNENSYVKTMSSSLASTLKLSTSSFYTTTTKADMTNTTIGTIKAAKSATLDSSTTFTELGITADCYITVVSDGTENIVTISPEQTLGDLMTTLAGYGIACTVDNGKVSFKGDGEAYIKTIAANLKTALKLTDTNYTTAEHNHTSNTNSTVTTFKTTETLTTESNVVRFINEANGGTIDDGYMDGRSDYYVISGYSNGQAFSYQIGLDDTVGDMLTTLAGYGIAGDVIDGKLTLRGSSNAYINYMTDIVAKGFNLGGASGNTDSCSKANYTTTTHTVTENVADVNQAAIKETITAAATGITPLEKLRHSDGAALSAYDLTITTKSDAGNVTTTITSFTAATSVYDVIDKLAEYGIEASIDTTGRFTVSSSSLTDFDLTGTLGTFIMGSAPTKRYDEGSISSVSSILKQKSEVLMDDSTLLSQLGVTDGKIIVYKDGIKYTKTIDDASSVGDFRTMLAEYGITSSIIEGKLQLNANGVVYLAPDASGASNILEKFNIEQADWTLGDYSQKSKDLNDTTTVTEIATLATRLNQLTNSTGTNLGITNGQIYVYQDGARNLVDINVNDTLGDLANKLAEYNITVGIASDGKLYFDGNNNSYMTTDGLSSGASNILTKLGISGEWNTRYHSTSETLNYEVTDDVQADGSTKMTDLQDADGNSLGITEGTYYVYQNGVRSTETITSDTTVNDFRATMASYGISTDFNEDGQLYVGGYNETYLATSATGYDTNAIAVLFEEWNFVNVYTSNNLDIPTDVVVSISETTKLADINEGTYQAGYITVVKDGVQTNIELTADDTVGDLMDELALYGFESVINSNGQLIIKNTGNSLLQAYSGAGVASNALDLLGIGLDTWISTNTYESGTVSVVTTTTEDISATRDTLLSELGVTTGEYYIYNNGIKYTAMISTDETIGSLMDTLQSFGIETSLVDSASGSVLSILGNGDSYIAKSASTTNSSNVVETIFTAASSENYAYSAYQKTTTLQTTTTAATDETLLSYFNKDGNVAEGNLSVTVDGVTNTLQVASDETLGTFMTKLEALGMEATLNDGNMVIQSGYKDVEITSAGGTGDSDVLQTLALGFNPDLGGYSASSTSIIDTQTVVEEKTLSVANYADYSTTMDLLNISNGSLTIYRDGEKATFQIDSSKTFGDLKDIIDDRFADVDLKFEDGYLTFYSTTDGISVEVGSTTDTSNFSAITGVSNDGTGIVKSARELYCANNNSIITTSGIFRNGDVVAGTFKIGDAEFTIDGNTRLSDIIAQINASQSANATAYWDSIDAKLVIQSRTTGSALVNIEAGTSNFTDIIGLTKSEWADADSDGHEDIGISDASVTKINVESQEIGENAKFAINGTYYTSTSNTIGSDVSRIKGLTINLKGISEGETTITVERDKETIANAVSDVVDAYNELIENIDKEIAKGEPLDDQFTLKLIRNQIRSLMTGSIAGGGVFKNLDSIGVSLEQASANNISTANINKLHFNKDNFYKAFDADRDALKTLLVGTDLSKGIFSQVESIVEQAVTTGYFASAEKSYNTQISRLDKKIQTAQKAVDRYKERLEAKFASMDLLISQIQNQYSSFLSG